MATYSIAHKPNTITSRVNWYVSPVTQSEPITVYSTQAEAIAHARNMPQEYLGFDRSIPCSVGIDWIHAADTNPLSFQISRTRTIIDLRLRTIPVHILPAYSIHR